MNDLERNVRTSLHSLADDAGTPAGPATVGAVVERHHRNRRRRAGVLAGATAALLVAAGVTAGAVAGPERDAPVAAAIESTAERAPAPGPASPSDPPAPETQEQEGAVSATAGTEAECAEEYSPAAVAGRAFAFDGTVTAIGPARQDPTGSLTPISAVTFRVHDWYRGGSGETVTVDLDTITGRRMIPSIPDYQVGTRLLVSGEPRWGGAPLDAAIAWSCGFTRPYGPGTAASWAAATD